MGLSAGGGGGGGAYTPHFMVFNVRFSNHRKKSNLKPRIY